MQAINATTMPKVVICHTPVIHNHYMECNAPKPPSLGWCYDSVCPWVYMVLPGTPMSTKKPIHIHTGCSTVSCNVHCIFFLAYYNLSSSVVAFV